MATQESEIRSHRERYDASGAVRITKKQLRLLEILAAAPDRRFETRHQFATVAAAAARRAYSSTYKGIARLPGEWVIRARTGKGIRFTLTERGNDIAAGRVKAVHSAEA